MSRKETRSKSRQNIFQTEETDTNLSRKRSERQASQGVKVLVNREKGISSSAMDVDSSSGKEEASPRRVGDKNKEKEEKLANQSTSSNVQSQSFNPISTLQPLSSNNPNLYPVSNTSQITIAPMVNPRSKRDDKVLNRQVFEKLIQDKIHKEGLDVRNMNEIVNFMNIGLENYMKNVVEKLISISRIRNVNLNLYSKQSEKNPVFKIHTFNLDRQVASGGVNNQNMQSNVATSNTQTEIVQNSYKDFSILFTKNMKNTMGMLEQYEELNLKKMRQEKVSLYKSKLEEITQQKEKEKESGTAKKETEGRTPGKTRLGRGNKMLKSVRNTLAKSQKRDELAKHKKETQNTLETFLDGRPRATAGNTTLSQHRFDTEMASNIGESYHNLETYTKLSEISKSEAPGTIGLTSDGSSNEINLTCFKYYTPNRNTKINLPSNIRRRITLKDLIHFLEGERKTPLQNLLLHRAIIRLNHYSH